MYYLYFMHISFIYHLYIIYISFIYHLYIFYVYYFISSFNSWMMYSLRRRQFNSTQRVWMPRAVRPLTQSSQASSKGLVTLRWTEGIRPMESNWVVELNWITDSLLYTYIDYIRLYYSRLYYIIYMHTHIYI